MVSDGSKCYVIKPLFINKLFSRSLLEIFIPYFGKVIKIPQEIVTICLLQKKHENKMITQTFAEAKVHYFA